MVWIDTRDQSTPESRNQKPYSAPRTLIHIQPHNHRPSWLPPYVGGRLHTPATKAVQTVVTAVATSAAAFSLVNRLTSAAAAAAPVRSPKLLSGLSLQGVRQSLRLDEVGQKGTVGATILSYARPILVVASPAALSAFITIKS